MLRPVLEEKSVASADDSYGTDDDLADEIASFHLDNNHESHSMYSGRRASSEKSKSSQFLVFGWVVGGKVMGLPAIVDVWHDRWPRPRRSVQVQALSGNVKQLKKAVFQISSDQESLVCSLPISKNLLDPQCAFSYLTDYEKFEDHPKIIARKLTVEHAGFEHYQMRIPLGARCKKDFVSKDQDPLFYGIQIQPYSNGEFCYHDIELFEDVDHTPKKSHFKNKDDKSIAIEQIAKGHVSVAPSDAESFCGMSYVEHYNGGGKVGYGVPASVGIPAISPSSNTSGIYNGVNYSDVKCNGNGLLFAMPDGYDGGIEANRTSIKRRAKYQGNHVTEKDNQTVG